MCREKTLSPLSAGNGSARGKGIWHPVEWASLLTHANSAWLKNDTTLSHDTGVFFRSSIDMAFGGFSLGFFGVRQVLEDVAICMSKCASNVVNGTGVKSGVSWMSDGVSLIHSIHQE